MGLPVEKLIAATNENDIFPKYLKNGNVIPQTTCQTISNAMDVAIPSNLDRIKKLFNNDIEKIKEDISSWCFSDKETKQTIYNIKKLTRYLTEPHTAVGILGLETYRKQTKSRSKGIVLGTAHPSKFANVIEPIIGKKLDLSPQLRSIQKKEKHSIKLSNEFQKLKNYLLGK